MKDNRVKAERDPPTPEQGQGIVQDEQAQDQPADKERARKVVTPNPQNHK